MLRIVNTNHSPVAVAGDLGTTVNTPASYALLKLLSRCSDPDGDAVMVSGVSASSMHSGTVALGPDALTYAPPTNYVGSDLFTYTVSDGHGGLCSANVTVTVANGLSHNITAWSYAAPNMTLDMAGIPGLTYRVQYTESLTPPINWTDFATNTAPSNGVFSVIDATAGGTNRFYRTVCP